MHRFVARPLHLSTKNDKSPNANRPRSAWSGSNQLLQRQIAQTLDQKKSSAKATDGENAPPIVHQVLREPGEALAPHLRDHFEATFSRTFEDVRLHSGPKAAAANSAVGALAFAVGNHIVLGSGAKASSTGADGDLLEHELTHVTQWQGRPIPSQLKIGPADGPAEQEARKSRGRPGQAASTSLERAVPICDEYQDKDPSTVEPGPGIKIEVSRKNKTAKVEASLEASGAEADAAKASTIQSNIKSHWNGTFPDGHKITTTVAVSLRPQNQEANSGATQVNIVRQSQDSRVRRHWLVGSRYVVLNLNDSDGLTLTKTAAHEFGHLLGLKDRYSESFGSQIKGKFVNGCRKARNSGGAPPF